MEANLQDVRESTGDVPCWEEWKYRSLNRLMVAVVGKLSSFCLGIFVGIICGSVAHPSLAA